MEEDNEIDPEKRSKMTRNKITILIIGFYAGLCVISDLAVKYYFKDKKKVETANLTRILIIFKIPYLIKPLYGFFLDFFPIFGYKKKSYLFLCFLVNATSWYFFIISNDKNMYFSIICLLFINISLSFTTVIGSAIQVDLSKMYENEKSNIGEKTSQLMSEYFMIKSLGTLVPSYFKGFLIEKYSNEEIKFHQKLLRTKICEIEPYKEEKFDFDLRKIESNAKETYDRIFELCRASIGRKNLDQYYKSIKLITGETNKEEKKTKYKKRNSQAYKTKDDFDLNKIYIDNNLSQFGKTYILNNNKQKIKVLENEYDILTSRESKIIDLKKQLF